MNKVTTELNNLIQDSLKLVINDVNHDLILGKRILIFKEVFKILNHDKESFKLFLVKLGSYVVEHIINLWKQSFQDTKPLEIIKLASNFLTDKNQDKNKLVRKSEDFWNELLEADDEKQTPSSVGMASVKVLQVALDDDFDFTNLTDQGIDPDELNAEFFGAAAFSNGATWNEESDSLKRKEFWEWWLEKAIPETLKAL
jgi:Immunity protein Imm5